MGVMVAAAFLMLFLAGVAVASNTHTVGEWYHGLGDGTDNDSYVHPFNHSNHGHAHSNWIEIRHLYSGALASKSCVCSHLHYNWDTGISRECLYSSQHRANDLNQHLHRHHYYCS